jgi:serine protease Do
MIKAILPQLKRTGRVVPAWLGVGIREMNEKLMTELRAPEGILVTEVYPGSPAEGQLKLGDVIVEFNGSKIGSASELAWMAATSGVNNDVVIKVFRQGKYLEQRIKVMEKPSVR